MRELYYSYVFWAAIQFSKLGRWILWIIMNNFLVDSFTLSEDFVDVFLIGKVRSALSGNCILSGASLPGSRAEVVILSGPSIPVWRLYPASLVMCNICGFYNLSRSETDQINWYKHVYARHTCKISSQRQNMSLKQQDLLDLFYIPEPRWYI